MKSKQDTSSEPALGEHPPTKSGFGPELSLSLGLACFPLAVFTFLYVLIIAGLLLVMVAVVQSILLAWDRRRGERWWQLWMAFHGSVLLGGFMALQIDPWSDAIAVVWGAVALWPVILVLRRAHHGRPGGEAQSGP